MSQDIIRLAGEADMSAIQAIYAPFVKDTNVSFEYEVPSVKELDERVRATLVYAPWLVYERDGHVAGYAYAGHHRSRTAYQWSVELSVYVGKTFRRKGIARALYTSLVALLRLQGFYNAYIGIALPNPGSVAFHERFGFKPVGVYHGVGYKHGTWGDVGWWEMAIQPKTEHPLPPVSLTEAQALPGWDDAMRQGVIRSNQLL